MGSLHVVRRLQLGHERHVLRHRVLAGHAFNLLPRVPLGLALEIEHARTSSVDVAVVGLVEQRVELELFVVRELRD